MSAHLLLQNKFQSSLHRSFLETFVQKTMQLMVVRDINFFGGLADDTFYRLFLAWSKICFLVPMSARTATSSSLCAESTAWNSIQGNPPIWRQVEVLLENEKIVMAVCRGVKWYSDGKPVEPIAWRHHSNLRQSALWRGLLTRC